MRLSEFPDTFGRKAAVKRGSPDLELPDDIADERMVLHVLEQRLRKADFSVVHRPGPENRS